MSLVPYAMQVMSTGLPVSLPVIPCHYLISVTYALRLPGCTAATARSEPSSAGPPRACSAPGAEPSVRGSDTRAQKTSLRAPPVRPRERTGLSVLWPALSVIRRRRPVVTIMTTVI